MTPALAAANNGNWQTAQRWARLLGRAYRITLTDRWEGGAHDGMIALHARRSAPSMQAWRQRAPGRPLVLALTGTDLYRDIDTHPEARAWVADADRLVVLNTLGARRLPADAQARAVTVLQSCGERQPLARSGRHPRALMVGPLRDEKDPPTYLRAAPRLAVARAHRPDHCRRPPAHRPRPHAPRPRGSGHRTRRGPWDDWGSPVLGVEEIEAPPDGEFA